MKVLGLEASTAAGSVAVVDGECLKGELWFCATRDHSEQLLAGVELLLRGTRLGVRDLDGLAVGLGPGSFTGLRIALSTAKGLAMALDLPLAGLPSLGALAHNAPFWKGLVCPMLDARRGAVYGGLFRFGGGETLEREAADGVHEVTSWVRSMDGPVLFLGTGAWTYRASIEGILGARAQFAPPELNHPRGAVVARLGRRRLLEQGEADLDTLVPLYLKRSEAEEKSRVKGGTGRG